MFPLCILTTSLCFQLVITKIEVPVRDALEQRIMTEILPALAKCESSGRIMAINKKESHGSSYGLFQFRLETLYHFADRYGIEKKDPLDPEFQRAVAREMLKEGRWKHWYNCGKIIGLDKVKFL